MLIGLNGCADEDPCAAFADFPDPDEISLTPRSDLEAEGLALRCSEGWVADEAIYQQVSTDLAAIREADPRMVDIRDYFVDPPMRAIMLLADDPETAQKLVAGNNEEFACLLDKLGGEASGSSDNSRFTVEFSGVYELNGVAWLFSDVPGVAHSSPIALVGDGDRIRFDIDSDPRQYLLEAGGGDCPAGCTEHHYYLWEVSDDASPTLVADWGNDIDGFFGERPEGFDVNEFGCEQNFSR